jgi:hypothetical protein
VGAARARRDDPLRDRHPRRYRAVCLLEYADRLAGFIIFADASVWRARGRSWIRSAPREFAFLALVSIPLWLVFEFYNGFIDNWYYVASRRTHC